MDSEITTCKIPEGFCLEVCRKLVPDRRFAPLMTTFLAVDVDADAFPGGGVEATQQQCGSSKRNRSCSAIVQAVDFRLKPGLEASG
eukprot:CAMPEP_0178395112 /NCGR_PEP_ID=MMETSP0689_2-20121128/13052_1 /TAXON_ID=160604 /ORGANISM="Amphidinium massartii, Strain CS-259" /LENGTH=85 /DNA_ID=CAMNT_0020015759 /DNA_START=40 /DNA_END=294 /DNA_ORIENTATION=-